MSDEPELPFEVDPVALERAIKRVPFPEREALLMKARDRMTYTEIGIALGLSASQAEVKVATALAKLHARSVRRRQTSTPRLCHRFRWPGRLLRLLLRRLRRRRGRG